MSFKLRSFLFALSAYVSHEADDIIIPTLQMEPLDENDAEHDELMMEIETEYLIEGIYRLFFIC